MPLGTLARLPKAARMWEHVYQGQLERGLSESRAAASAWAAVEKAGYHKDAAGTWRAPGNPHGSYRGGVIELHRERGEMYFEGPHGASVLVVEATQEGAKVRIKDPITGLSASHKSGCKAMAELARKLIKREAGRSMAKKKRSAAQKAATKKMLAANKKKRGKKKTKKNRKKATKKRGKKKAKKSSKKRTSPAYCLVSPVTLEILSCHKTRARALEAMSKRRGKYVPLLVTRGELKKIKENRPKRRRKKTVVRRTKRWNP